MPRPGVGVFGGASKPVLEIKPDSPFVVFYGEGSESQVAELTGKLVLTNPESMSVRSIKITLTGSRKVSWSTTNTVTPQPILWKGRFFHETVSMFPADDSAKNKAHKLNAGVHEWDFKFKMPSTLDESVEGLGTNWIVYNLTATVDRGYLSKQLLANQHIRVIRTLGRDVMESMPMEQINEDIWASKVAYKITVPQKNYIVGTAITTDFLLIPLRKGVEISTIKMELLESRQLFCDYAGRRISHQHDTVVCQTEGDMPPNSAHVVPEGVEDVDQIFDESHRFQMSLELPRSLKHCRQSVDTENIRISHKLRLYVNLKNPEGHTSQLLVKNHLHLFISPNLPPNEDQSVVVDHHIISTQAMQDSINQNAPPTYGLHQLDELYNDIDPSGFMTPGLMTPGGNRSMGNSGANTPFSGHSRSGSAEDLASLDAIAHTNGGGASAAALQHRLHNLSISQNSRGRYQPTRHQSYHSSGDTTPHNGADEQPHPPPARGYFAGAEVQSPEYDMEALSRIPSYNTAVRTPARTPVYEDLPTYEIATSRPSSPNRTPRSGSHTPSPTRSLDTLTEETERNTDLNSRRESPRSSGDGR
ncbi:carbon catabolite repression protein cred [Amniculicola lignicola CBS 123094]|uniref:Carbon catabolite repression protein cred n=1 Tax=Amniculicola lignicola CBS 123094 TaxID=1392246 RepID=A0A6A5WDQ4_9PLEO|nr:carbon catabolite repression protein cred [Amniculicola lignicola CBS 123094]